MLHWCWTAIYLGAVNKSCCSFGLIRGLATHTRIVITEVGLRSGERRHLVRTSPGYGGTASEHTEKQTNRRLSRTGNDMSGMSQKKEASKNLSFLYNTRRQTEAKVFRKKRIQLSWRGEQIMQVIKAAVCVCAW